MKNYRFPNKLAFLPYVMAMSALALSVHAQTTDIPTDEQISAAVTASNQKRGNIVFWRSDKLGLIFGYDQRWKPVNASQKSTVSVVNWTTRASDGLMATCYLEINDSSDVARLKPSQITKNAKAIADAMLRNGKLRDPAMRLVTWRPISQDNYPAVYLERDMRVENLGRTFNARLYSIVTAWKGREVNFECASEVPIKMPKVAGVVEGPIKTVLGSLQFVREAAK